MKKDLVLKSTIGGLIFAVAFTMNTIAAKADLTDVTDDFEREGTPTIELITDEENQEHIQDNLEAQENGEQTPAPQDAEAIVDNSQGGDDTPLIQIPDGPWVDYDPVPGDEHPEPGLEDDVDRKTPDVPKTDDKGKNVAGAVAASGLATAVGYGIYTAKKKHDIHKVISSSRSTYNTRALSNPNINIRKHR